MNRGEPTISLSEVERVAREFAALTGDEFVAITRDRGKRKPERLRVRFKSASLTYSNERDDVDADEVRRFAIDNMTKAMARARAKQEAQRG